MGKQGRIANTYQNSITDFYKEATNTGMERFLLFLQDSIYDLEVNGKQFDPDYLVLSAAFFVEYIKICKKEDTAKSMPKRYVNNAIKKVRRRQCTLLECYKSFFPKYFLNFTIK